MAGRRKPETIWTNKGKSFISAVRKLSVLLKHLNQTKIENSLINEGVTRKFNPQSSLWMGVLRSLLSDLPNGH